MAYRVCRVVLLVAFVSDRKELAALARCRSRPPPLRRARGRRLRGLASLHDRPDRGIRAARGAELVLPLGRDGGARPQAGQSDLHRDVGVRLAGRLRLLLRVSNQKNGVPAKTGIHLSASQLVEGWVPAFAGTRMCGSVRILLAVIRLSL